MPEAINGSEFRSDAILFIETQRPWPEHPLMHADLSHAAPVKPRKQAHSPVVRSHFPLFEHSARE